MNKYKFLNFARNILSQGTVEEALISFYKVFPSEYKIKTLFISRSSPYLNQKLLFNHLGVVKSLDLNLNILPQKPEGIIINKREISSCLASVLNRPVGQVICVPLKESSFIFYFEHGLKFTQINNFLDFFRDREDLLRATLRNISLEADLKNTAMMWEGVFNGVIDPIVLLNSSGQFIGQNDAFKRLISEDNFKGFESLKKSMKFKTRKKIYDIQILPLISKDNVSLAVFREVSQIYKLRSQLVQNEKMVSVGNFAGHINNELSNPLSEIKNLTQTLQKDKLVEPQTKKDLKDVEQAVIHCQKIIKNLQNFSGENIENKKKKISLSQLVKSTISLLKLVLNPFRLEVEYISDRSDMVEVAPELLRQVIFNLVNNACQASCKGGVISLKIFKREGSAIFEVKDFGCGIEKSALKEIFEPFYTTKKQGMGTGLGLSMSQNIVESFKGRIEVQSEAEKGSAFQIILPVV